MAEVRALRASVARRHRSTREVFEDHLRLAQARDVEIDLARNYAPDCVVLTGRGTYRGHDGVRELAQTLSGELPTGEWEWRYRAQLVEGDVAYLEWSADAGDVVVEDGADSFVIREGLIVAQTIHYTVRDRAGRVVVDWNGDRAG